LIRIEADGNAKRSAKSPRDESARPQLPESRLHRSVKPACGGFLPTQGEGAPVNAENDRQTGLRDFRGFLQETPPTKGSGT